MKRLTLFTVLCVCSTTLFSQNITNTLGTSGAFKIKDATNNYLTVSQPTGYLSLYKSLVIPNSTDSTLGVIFKGTDRFIHNYSLNSLDGYNTFIGIKSGNFTMTGGYNTAIGDQSLFSNTEGYGNIALGFQSLYSNTTGFQNTAVGLGSLQYNTSAYNNTAVGYLALNLNTTGYHNTASGCASLQNNTAGEYNTSSGTYSLNNNISGHFNSAFGSSSLYSNTIGSENTSMGTKSLFFNTQGNKNTALGLASLYSNTTGRENTSAGYYSLYSNTGGFQNTSVGYYSLYSNTGGYLNTASGFHSLWSNTTGYENTAMGTKSLFSNTTGHHNTALGEYAGSTITTGNNLTCLGNDANPTSDAATNQITLGNENITSLRCNVTTITSLSDARDKKNIKDLDLGIDFLMKITPRLFNWDKREWYENNTSDGSKIQKTPTAGFIAQELDEVQTMQNSEWLSLVLKDNPEKWEATPGNLLPIMVKAIQDLKRENDELLSANDKLKDVTVTLAEKLSKFEQTQNMLVAEIEKLKTNNNDNTNVSLGEK